jgi:hypothetical protein
MHKRSQLFAPILMDLNDGPGISGNRFLCPSSASETLDALLDSASVFSAAIEGQLEATQSDPVPSDFVQRTIAYASAKIAYFERVSTTVEDLGNPDPQTPTDGDADVR